MLPGSTPSVSSGVAPDAAPVPDPVETQRVFRLDNWARAPSPLISNRSRAEKQTDGWQRTVGTGG